jgi:glycosyltransferase involved in cell wall biosynthesis
MAHPVRILDISPLLPFPPRDGGRKSVYYPIRELVSRGHTIRFCCLAEREDPAAIREMERLCALDVVISPKAPTAAGAIQSLGRTVPYDLSRFHSPRLLEVVRRRVREEQFDVIQVEGIHAAYYGLELRRDTHLPMVMRVHNVQSLNMARALRTIRNPFVRAWLLLDTARIRRYERRVHGLFESNMVVSREERETLIAQNPAVRCDVVPMGVDLGEFAPRNVPEEPGTVLWMGALNWPPNRESFWWFYREIVPLLAGRMPGVKIKIAGNRPPADILAVRHPNVEILGFVDDIADLMARSQVCVVPLQAGSGVRVKLLEMFAMGRPVVTTRIGCEGLDVEDGVQAVLADSAGAFASAVADLLLDPNRRWKLGAAALAHVRARYSWQSVASQYEVVYRAAIARDAGGGGQ